MKDLALHVASPAAPRWSPARTSPANVLADERRIFEAQAHESGKPETSIEKIVEGKLEKFFKDHVLLEQPFVKDDSKTVQSYLDEVGAKTGEKIVVRRFVRYKLGEDAE